MRSGKCGSCIGPSVNWGLDGRRLRGNVCFCFCSTEVQTQKSASLVGKRDRKMPVTQKTNRVSLVSINCLRNSCPWSWHPLLTVSLSQLINKHCVGHPVGCGADPDFGPALQGFLIQCYLAVCMLSCFSCVWLFGTPWTLAHQAPLSIGILQVRILEWLAWHPPGVRTQEFAFLTSFQDNANVADSHWKSLS